MDKKFLENRAVELAAAISDKRSELNDVLRQLNTRVNQPRGVTRALLEKDVRDLKLTVRWLEGRHSEVQWLVTQVDRSK
jgi:hypothetical protein